MTAFYLSERSGSDGGSAPDSEYYFPRRYRAENPAAPVDVISPGFNDQWQRACTLIPDDASQYALNRYKLGDYFSRPTFCVPFEGLVEACHQRMEHGFVPARSPLHFIPWSGLYSLGNDASAFIRSLFGEELDLEQEQEMRETVTELIIGVLTYTLGVSMVAGSRAGMKPV